MPNVSNDIKKGEGVAVGVLTAINPVVGAAAAAVLALANSVIDFRSHSPWWFFDRGLSTLKRYQDNLNKNIKDGVKPNTPVVTQPTRHSWRA